MTSLHIIPYKALLFAYTRMFQSRAQAFSFLIIYTTTFGLILPLICHDWPYSIYFNKARWKKGQLEERVKSLNDERLNDAWSYLIYYHHQVKNKSAADQNGQGKKTVDLAIGVVTVPRQLEGERLGYLTQTISQLLKTPSSDEQSDIETIELFLCDTHQAPGQHEEADQLELFVKHFKVINDKESEGDIFEKERKDYIFCLQKALEFSPKYVLILEDDVLPNPNIYRILNGQLKQYLESHPNMDRLGFIKLYFPEKWLGYSWCTQHVLELISIGCLGGFIFILAKLIVIRRRQTLHSLLNRVFAHGACYAILLVWFIGRQHIIRMRSAFPHMHMTERNPACCTQGVLYRSFLVKSLIPFLANTTCTETFAIDLAIDKYMDKYEYQKLLIQPNVLNHIGMVSTVRENSKQPEHFLF